MTTYMPQNIYTTINHSVKHIDFPLTDKLMELVGDNVGICGNCIQICFHPVEQKKRAGARDPRVANGKELKVGASPIALQHLWFIVLKVAFGLLLTAPTCSRSNYFGRLENHRA